MIGMSAVQVKVCKVTVLRESEVLTLRLDIAAKLKLHATEPHSGPVCANAPLPDHIRSFLYRSQRPYAPYVSMSRYKLGEYAFQHISPREVTERTALVPKVLHKRIPGYV